MAGGGMPAETIRRTCFGMPSYPPVALLAAAWNLAPDLASAPPGPLAFARSDGHTPMTQSPTAKSPARRIAAVNTATRVGERVVRTTWRAAPAMGRSRPFSISWSAICLHARRNLREDPAADRGSRGSSIELPTEAKRRVRASATGRDLTAGGEEPAF